MSVITVTNDKLSSGHGFTFGSYSADGNPGTVSSEGVTKTFAYSYENRVKSLAYSTGGTETYRYNADGQRVERADAGGTTRFVYDGSTVIAEANGSNNILDYFLPGVGFVDNGTQRYYWDNALGSNVATTGPLGAVTSRTEYDAYGVEFNVMSGVKSVTIDGVTTRIQADFAWFDKKGNLRIAEVKTGPRAGYTPNQRQILPNLLEANGGQRATIRSAKIPGKYGQTINVILDRITRVRM